eukprot:403362709
MSFSVIITPAVFPTSSTATTPVIISSHHNYILSLFIVCRMCVTLIQREEQSYKCKFDGQQSSHSTSLFSLNTYLLDLINSSPLYADFKPISELQNRPRPRIKGIVPMEDNRHVNEKKILSKMTGKKYVRNVRFIIDEQSLKKKAKKTIAYRYNHQHSIKDFPHVLYLNQLTGDDRSNKLKSETIDDDESNQEDNEFDEDLQEDEFGHPWEDDVSIDSDGNIKPNLTKILIKQQQAQSIANLHESKDKISEDKSQNEDDEKEKSIDKTNVIRLKQYKSDAQIQTQDHSKLQVFNQQTYKLKVQSKHKIEEQERKTNEQLQEEQQYMCNKHLNEKLRHYCVDCKLSICAECVFNHQNHSFIPGNKQLKEAKLAQVFSLKNLLINRQEYLKTQINLLSQLKDTLRSEHAKQKQTLEHNFKQMRDFLDTYEQRYEKVLMDQYSEHVVKIGSTVDNYKVQVIRLAEMKSQVDKYIVQMKGWQYNKVLVESVKIDKTVDQNIDQFNKLETKKVYENYRLYQENPLQKIVLKSQDIISLLLTYFEKAIQIEDPQQKLQEILKEQMKQEQEFIKQNVNVNNSKVIEDQNNKKMTISEQNSKIYDNSLSYANELQRQISDISYHLDIST